jgi:TrmH family RNA methyltransferase
MTYSLKPLKWYARLAEKKGRLEAGAFAIEGERAVRQVAESHPESILEIITVESPPPDYDRFNCRRLDERQFKSISAAGTPQGIMAIVTIPEGLYSPELPENAGRRVLLMEDIQDPGNAGTLIRTAAAFGYSGVIMTDNGADPLSPKCVQSTAGSILSLWIRRTSRYLETVDSLRARGYVLSAAVLEGNDDPSVSANDNFQVLALGNEASGLSDEIVTRADRTIKIDIDRTKAESLNVAACGAICMYLSTQICSHRANP